ncbi:hypothetical protein N7462_003357 [Penicillium macrosclerotiorum]|uniref:uncharacterized protein n=1 Tax=Penicillium macrosclerotiorum TaxID=303699 RepID=UPI0025484342|nr:uncharacterized protein N7462_003357 [Penicillium macrosclerotiorum]KAJ5688965.1 hypothetical protein N7462_003357 [Penicillium macrosclerotiorum]
MKGGLRFALCAGLLLLFSLFLLEAHIQDICNQYRAGAYLVNWLDRSRPSRPPLSYEVGDKVIVMARLEEENIDWVEEELPDWQRALYVVNPSSETRANDQILTTPLNKGHEAMAYLTYVIDHYYVLPSTIAFLHAHRSGFLLAWHVDAPLHDNVLAMRALQLDFVQQNGYVNLRCNWNPGCKEGHRFNRHVTNQVWSDIFYGTSTPPLNVSSPYEQESATQEYLRKPDQIAAACCAQFAVSRSQVQRRPRDDYVKFRQWLIDTELNDASSGRVMEFLWHIIFGMGSIYCPDEQLCYCQVYGNC